MFTTPRLSPSLALLGVLVACGVDTPVETSETELGAFGFGRVATAEEVAAADIDVRFDGRGLPPGRGSEEEGAALYRAKCAACHGVELEGSPQLGVRPLVGEVRHAVNNLPFAPPIFGYIRRAMPLDAPGSLRDDEVYALVAFLLERAGVVAAAGSSLDAQSLAAVSMPNRENFIVSEGVGVSVPGARAKR